MKDMLNVMDKFLALGMSIDDVILRSTWNPAREIKREELEHRSPGAVADLAVLKLARALNQRARLPCKPGCALKRRRFWQKGRRDWAGKK